MSGFEPDEGVEVAHAQRPGERGAQARLLGLRDQALELGFREEVEQVAPVLGQRVDEHAVATALPREVDDEPRVDPLVEVVVREGRGDELRGEPLEGALALAEDPQGRFVVALDEPDLDRGGVQRGGPEDRERDRPGLVRHGAQRDAHVDLLGEGVADLPDDGREVRPDDRLLEVLHVHDVGVSANGL